MLQLRSRLGIAWFAIVLVLLPLIAPAISHALSPARGALDREAAGVWCSPSGDARLIREHRLAAALADAGKAATHDPAPADTHPTTGCDYCALGGLSQVPPQAPAANPVQRLDDEAPGAPSRHTVLAARTPPYTTRAPPR